MDKSHPQRLSAIKEVLARNDLYAVGVEPKAPFNPAQHVNVSTQVNLVPGLRVENMSDQEFSALRPRLHGGYFGLKAKYENLKAGTTNPLIDPGGYQPTSWRGTKRSKKSGPVNSKTQAPPLDRQTSDLK